MRGTFWIDVADVLSKMFLIGTLVLGGGYIVVELGGFALFKLLDLL